MEGQEEEKEEEDEDDADCQQKKEHHTVTWGENVQDLYKKKKVCCVPSCFWVLWSTFFETWAASFDGKHATCPLVTRQFWPFTVTSKYRHLQI